MKNKHSIILICFICLLIFITSCSAQIAPVVTSTQALTTTPAIKITPTPNPLKPVKGRILFNISSRDNPDKKLKTVGVFIFDPQTLQLKRISQDDLTIADVSNDGELVLLNNKNLGNSICHKPRGN